MFKITILKINKIEKIIFEDFSVPDSTEGFSYVAGTFQCLNCVSSHL